MDSLRGRKRAPPTFDDFRPNIEWSEDPAKHVLRVDLPGFERKDLRVQVDNTSKIIVKGRKQVEGVDNKYLIVDQTFDVPQNSDVNKITGTFDDGCLKLIIPKVATAEKEAPQTTPSFKKKETDEKPTSQQTVPPPDGTTTDAEENQPSQIASTLNDKKREAEEKEVPQKIAPPDEKKEKITPPVEKKERADKEAPQRLAPPDEKKEKITPPDEKKEKITPPDEKKEGADKEAPQSLVPPDEKKELAEKEIHQRPIPPDEKKGAADKVSPQRSAPADDKKEARETEECHKHKKTEEKDSIYEKRVKTSEDGKKSTIENSRMARVLCKRKFEEGWLDYGIIDSILNKVHENKKVITVAVVAFSIGFYVSHKLRSTGK